jgi:hypothetical protein
MYALTTNEGFKEAEPGVIFCFKQTKDFDMTNNGLAPYILLYLTEEGEVHQHYTFAKSILDHYRKLSFGVQEPFNDLVKQFNQETNDGENMSDFTDLLKQSIDIVKGKQEVDAFDSFFTPGGTSMQTEMDLNFETLELISFLIIKGEA